MTIIFGQNIGKNIMQTQLQNNKTIFIPNGFQVLLVSPDTRPSNVGIYCWTRKLCFYIILMLVCYSTTICAIPFSIVKDPWAFAGLKMQYKNMVEQLIILKKQAVDIRKQLQDMDRQVAKLTNSKYDWHGVQNELKNLGNIISQMQGIAYDAQKLDRTFSETFPGYQNKQKYFTQYEKIINTAQNTLSGVLQSVSLAAKDFKAAEKRLNDLKNASESAIGETSAIQAANQIAIEQIEQLQLLRQVIIAQVNAETIYYAAQIQKEASSKAELDEVITRGKEQKITGVLNNHPVENL
jgi:P-type conjugative transfer protein TrbJ